MTDENKAAESSAAAVAEPVFNPQDQYTWTPEQREHWNKTGNLPELPKKQESAPAAAPAEEAHSEPEGKTAAESETAPKQGKKERKPGEKLSAEERIAQLTAKNRELEGELKTERERSRVTEPKPTVTEAPKQKEPPKRPNPFAWKGTPEEFDAAMEAWENHHIQQAVQQFQREEAAKAQTAKLQKQLDDAKAKYPEAEASINRAFDGFAKVQLPGVIRQMFDDSEVLVDVMRIFGDDTTRENFIATAMKNPGKAIRVLTQIERDIETAQSNSAKVEPEAKSETKPPEPKPRAPKPPSEVGGRGTAPEDELRSAAQSGDFRAFEAEQNRRKFAKAS